MKRINSIISPSLINSSSTTKCVNSVRTFRSNPKGFATEVKIDFNAPPKAPKADAKWEEMTFALTSTDYMYTAGANKGEEFTSGKIVPYGPIALYPSATVLNYGQGSFEGIKAFRTTKDNIVVFRPDQNAKRMNAGAVDFCMSTVPERIYLEAIEQVVKANSHWVPPVNKGALYLRPILFGDGAQLGVAPSNHYAFIVWASPVGSYFKAGKITPINLLVSPGQHRAAPIGSGHVKAIGNYAPVFKVQKYAKDNGYTEVLFLDARNDKYVEEAGASNFFCLTKDGVLRTPELGAILPGVTRMSLMQLAKDMGIKISEERLSIETVLESKEVFCSGTGASVTPVGSVTYKGNKVVFNNGEVGPLSQALYNGLLDIQLERTADKYNWLFRPWK